MAWLLRCQSSVADLVRYTLFKMHAIFIIRYSPSSACSLGSSVLLKTFMNYYHSGCVEITTIYTFNVKMHYSGLTLFAWNKTSFSFDFLSTSHHLFTLVSSYWFVCTKWAPHLGACFHFISQWVQSMQFEKYLDTLIFKRFWRLLHRVQT